MTREEDLRAMAEFSEEGIEDVTSPEDELAERVLNKRNVVLAGPPGTGKTRLINRLKTHLEGLSKLGVFRLVQFHREYSYQDFMEGYEPTEHGFKAKEGVFKKFLLDVEEAKSTDTDRSPDVIDVFAIDEINRADTSSVFGELLILLDDPEARSVQLARSNHSLSLPASVVIVGTMNTADKSIALIDFALRRRFSFVFVPPDYEQMVEWLNEYGFVFADFSIQGYVNAAQALNNRIAQHPLLGKNMTLGQSMFVPKRPRENKSPFTLQEITMAFSDSVLPQLEAYFGFGAKQELVKIINPVIAKKMQEAERIMPQDVVAFVRILESENQS